MALNTPDADCPGPSQFEFYSEGGLDIAFLGFSENDKLGEVIKLVENVEQIAHFSCAALKRGQDVIYMTERAVFDLLEQGLVLTEIAAGVHVSRDAVERMQFRPHIPAAPQLMSNSLFTEKTVRRIIAYVSSPHWRHWRRPDRAQTHRSAAFRQ
jgi:acyl CoA:acetate/3-ketoacid CoA transferase